MASSPKPKFRKRRQHTLLPPEIKIDTKLDKRIEYGTYAAYAVLLVVALFTWKVTWLHLGETDWLSFDVGPGLVLLIAIHAFFSVFKQNVGKDDFAIREVYGRVTATKLSTGPKFNSFGLHQMEKIDEATRIRQLQAPGPPEIVQWTDEHVAIAPGKVAPIYMMTGAPKGKSKSNLDKQMQLGISYYITWIIDDPLVFLLRMKTPERCNDLLREWGDEGLNEEFQDRTVGVVLDERTEINTELDDVLRTKTRGTGVQILQVGVTAYNLSHALAISMRDRISVDYDAETRIVKAKTKKREDTLDGEARAAARQAMGTADAKSEEALLNARAAGQGKMMETLSVPGEVVIATEAARVIVPKGAPIFGATAGMMDALGPATVLKQVGVGEGKPSGSKEPDQAKPAPTKDVKE